MNGKYIDAVENSYLPFLDNMKYKYIIDLFGLNGHSGRRFFSLFCNRVVFIPKEDENKQFFEVGDNPIVPNVHYIEYSVKKLEEIPMKIKFLEENPNEYERIRKNCNDYSDKYLCKDKVYNFIKITVEQKSEKQRINDEADIKKRLDKEKMIQEERLKQEKESEDYFKSKIDLRNTFNEYVKKNFDHQSIVSTINNEINETSSINTVWPNI